MAQPCKAILIDPFKRTVSEVDWNGDYHHIYQLTDCDTFDVARINAKGDGIFVDDEGLFKEEQAFFVYNGYGNPLAGKGLILGSDREGESVKPHVTLKEVQEKVAFVMPLRVNGEVAWLKL
jgi:hypothetical protein